MPNTIREVLTTAIDVIEAIPFPYNITLSVAAVDAGRMSNTTTEKAFAVTMQTNNTDKFRDGTPGHMRLNHDLTVDLLCRIFPNDQMRGYQESIDIEEQIIQALLHQADLPIYRVLYTRTRRALTSSGEYLASAIEFSIEQSLRLPA